MLTLDPRRVRSLLLRAVGALSFLTVLSLSVQEWFPGSTTANGLAFFDASRESSVPTFLSSLLLLACAALAALIARSDAGKEPRWWLLALVLVALGLDEAIAFHEATSEPLRRLLEASGVLYFTWVVPGVLFVLAVTASLAPLLGQLPRPQRRLLVAAAALFFGGAIGFELAEGWVFDRHGADSAAMIPLLGIEETLEMLGAVLMLYVLALRLAPWSGTVRVSG